MAVMRRQLTQLAKCVANLTRQVEQLQRQVAKGGEVAAAGAAGVGAVEEAKKEGEAGAEGAVEEAKKEGERRDVSAQVADVLRALEPIQRIDRLDPATMSVLASEFGESEAIHDVMSETHELTIVRRTARGRLKMEARREVAAAAEAGAGAGGKVVEEPIDDVRTVSEWGVITFERA